MAAQPRIVTRREWGAAFTIPGGRGVAPSSRRFFVLHWPVMNVTDERAAVRSIERIHRNQGWAAAPGYNYLVGQSGTVYEGCGRDVRGIHSPPRNTDGWGVCVLQPTNGTLSQQARNGTRALYDWLCTVAGRTLTRSWHARDFATACPGPQLIAWAQAGMPAQGGAPSPTPTPPEVFDMVAAEVADNGALHVFSVAADGGALFYTWQPPGKTAWNGGATGKGIAGLTRFAAAPSGRRIRGVSARKATNGALHVFVWLDNGALAYTWQRKGETGWNGGGPGKGIAALTAFAPRP